MVEGPIMAHFQCCHWCRFTDNSINLGGISDSLGKEVQVGFGILKIGPSVAELLQF